MLGGRVQCVVLYAMWLNIFNYVKCTYFIYKYWTQGREFKNINEGCERNMMKSREGCLGNVYRSDTLESMFYLL